jgi:eukaryotic-like serine/threonine-protein kinase
VPFDSGTASRIEFLYEPPTEYDFTVVFSRDEGIDSITQMCVGNGRPFSWNLDGWKGEASCFELIEGKSGPKTKIGLTNGRRYTSIVKVRKDRIQAFLDDKLITEHTTDFQDMSNWEGVALRTPGALGIGTGEDSATFYSARVTEITGTGRPLRGR